MISSWSCCFPSGRPFPFLWVYFGLGTVSMTPEISEPLREIPIRSFRAEGPRASSSATSEACILKRLVESVVDSWPIGFPPKHPWSYKKCPVPVVLLCGATKKRQNPKNNVKVNGWSWTWRMDTSKIPFRSSWQVVKLFVGKLSTKIPKSGVPIHYSILTQWTWIHSPCSADCFSGIFLFWTKSQPSETPDFEKILPDEGNLVDVILESYETVVKACHIRSLVEKQTFLVKDLRFQKPQKSFLKLETSMNPRFVFFRWPVMSFRLLEVTVLCIDVLQQGRDEAPGPVSQLRSHIFCEGENVGLV